jgi:hypothetical protein
VTGELYPFADELDRRLNEKRIFSFRMSHAAHFFTPSEVRPYTVRFCSFGPQWCVAACGERYRTPSLMAHSMEWDRAQIMTHLHATKSVHQENKAAVEAFEKSLQGGKTFFAENASRIWDRGICIFPDVSADSVALNLFKKIGLSEEEGWKQVATTNMCSWNVVKMFRHWWIPSPKTEDLRGLLIIGTTLLAKKDFGVHLQAAYNEVKAEQSWSV